MASTSRHNDNAKTVAVVGGGFAGSLFAMKLTAAKPDWTIFLVEERARLGRGVAYGTQVSQHLLNVPVNRMEVGLAPRFADWLRQHPALLREALEESGGCLTNAFVPRQLFGDYLEQQIAKVPSSDKGGLRRVHGSASAISQRREVVLDDGRVFPTDIVVLATGNPASCLSFGADRKTISDRIIHDPWAHGALTRIAPEAAILLVGSGLTTVDMVLALRAQGHRGPIRVVSRHGLLPKAHKPGGSWVAFLDARASPIETLRAIRAEVRKAQSQAVPWQRVFDVVRPSVASIWHGWSLGQRAQFLRHLRTIWDVHRHRMAERTAAAIHELIEGGKLRISAGRILTLDEHQDGVTVVLYLRKGRTSALDVEAVINCTGPQTDLRSTSHLLLRDLLAQGLVKSDPIGLGLESEDCAVKNIDGAISNWLYALGSLTRPAWWEITAVPEINAQIDRLVRKVSGRETSVSPRSLAAVFLDMGASI